LSAWQGGTEGYIAPEVKQSGDLDERLDLYSLGQVLRKLLMHGSAGEAAEEITILKELADDLTKEDPGSRPNTASAVIDRLVPISGRRELEVAARAKVLEKVKAKSTLSLWTRRSMLASTVTLVPYLLGRYAKVWVTGRASIKSHFIPGVTEDLLQSIPFRLPQSGVEELSLDDARIKGLNFPEESYYSHQATYWGIRPDVKSVVIESEPVRLPEEELQGNMVRIVVQCDAPPKSVSWELHVAPIGEQQSGSELAVEGKRDQNWIRLGYRDNYFGGLTQRDLIGTIDPLVLEGCKKVKFRIVLSAKQKWGGQGWPPIMLVVKKLTPEISEGGSLWLWFRKRA
jgi:hypothetical protein